MIDEYQPAPKRRCWLRVNRHQLLMECIPRCCLHLQELWRESLWPRKQSTRSGSLLSFPFYFNALLLILTGLFLHLVPPLQPATTPLLLWNCFSPVFLLMLRGLWTAASIFTPHSVASLWATQIFRGTRAHLEYWWTLLCTLQTDVSS